MGNSGSYTPPPATPMPIEDSIGSRAERAALIAKQNGAASRSANDLDEPNANKADPVTRASLAQSAVQNFDKLAPQSQPRGPADRVSGPRMAPAAAAGRMNTSAVVTG